MKCEKFYSEITRPGCSEIGDDAKQHISECGRCRELFDRRQALDDALKSDPNQSTTRMPAELHASIMEEVSNLRHEEKAQWTFNPFIKAAIGCAAAVLLILATFTFDSSDEGATADATPETGINLLLAENMRGAQAIFNASELATRGLSEEFDLLKEDIANLTEKYNRFIETRLFMASND